MGVGTRLPHLLGSRAPRQRPLLLGLIHTLVSETKWLQGHPHQVCGPKDPTQRGAELSPAPRMRAPAPQSRSGTLSIWLLQGHFHP